MHYQGWRCDGHWAGGHWFTQSWWLQTLRCISTYSLLCEYHYSSSKQKDKAMHYQGWQCNGHWAGGHWFTQSWQLWTLGCVWMSNADNLNIAQILKGISTESLPGKMHQGITQWEECIERRICTGIIYCSKWTKDGTIYYQGGWCDRHWAGGHWFTQSWWLRTLRCRSCRCSSGEKEKMVSDQRLSMNSNTQLLW